MPKVTYVFIDESKKTLDLDVGTTIRDGALDNGIEGIEGDCGGLAMCATCHVYVSDAFKDKLPPPNEDETDMLEGTAAERTDASRLSCQIEMTDEIDGIEVYLPETQY